MAKDPKHAPDVATSPSPFVQESLFAMGSVTIATKRLSNGRIRKRSLKPETADAILRIPPAYVIAARLQFFKTSRSACRTIFSNCFRLLAECLGKCNALFFKFPPPASPAPASFFLLNRTHGSSNQQKLSPISQLIRCFKIL